MCSGTELYAVTRERLEKALLVLPPPRIEEILGLTLKLVLTAKEQEVETAADDLVRFSRETLPQVLVRIRETQERHRRTNEVADALVEGAGRIAGVLFLITRLEAEPEWYRAADRNGWSSLAKTLARDYRKVKLPPGIQDRLLALVLREIRRDLTSPRHGSRYLYADKKGWFWKEKAEVFANEARAIIEEHGNDRGVVLTAARYLYYSLKLKKEATDTLLAAANRGKITDDGRLTLTDWLHRAKRFEEALAQAHKLHGADQNNMDHRRMMILCLDATGRKVEADAYATETIHWFKREGIWDLHARRDLARVMLKLGYFARSEEIYREIVSVYRESPPRRRRHNQDRLSEAYIGLARSLAGLGRTDEGIEAAANGVVAAGKSRGRRNNALRGLKDVFKQVKDLDAWVEAHEAEVAKTGLDAPLLRLAAGSAYLSKKKYAKSIEQLRIARQLSPEDETVHQTFLQAARRTRKKELVEEAWLAHIAAFPRELRLYDQLGLHYDTIGRKDEAERAWTTLVEADPYEPKGREMLNEIRDR